MKQTSFTIPDWAALVINTAAGEGGIARVSPNGRITVVFKPNRGVEEFIERLTMSMPQLRYGRDERGHFVFEGESHDAG